jgi:hypothetical protein
VGLHKAQGAAKPTALGTLQQAATYGATKPTNYGTPRSAPLAIWAANIRKGHSQKKFKSKKGPPTYVENIDMLVAANPVSTILQMWSNQSNAYTLDFKRVRIDAAAGGSWHDAIAISDPDFYAICAVTLECINGIHFSFNDYGAPGPSEYVNQATTIYEFPLWNGYQHGPDIGDPNLSRFPHYFWKPSMGNVFNIGSAGSLAQFSKFSQPVPVTSNPFGGTFFIYVYYAAKNNTTKKQSPLAWNRFQFEDVLANGTEYADAGLSSQQVLNPHYCGIGSSDIDLGTAGMIPSWRLEVQGTNYFLPSALAAGGRGDCEYPDMVEDLIKSGVVQTGVGFGLIQRGVNCNDLPGPVQANWWDFNAPSNPGLLYSQPNKLGSVLIAAARWNASVAGTSPTINDTGGDTWNDIYTSTGSTQHGVWWADSNGSDDNLVNMIYGGGGFASQANGYILEMDPGLTQLDGSPVVAIASGSGTLSASIPTTGHPSYIVAIILTDTGIVPSSIPPQWRDLFPAAVHSWSVVYGRKVSAPGTYGLTINVGSLQTTMVLIAVKSAQASEALPYPKALGNIVDFDTLMNVRLQCRAGGLQGSLAMDSQRKVGDWLQDIYTCMNAAPVWSGFKLKSIAYSEVSVLGDGSAVNGATPATAGLASAYWSPTSGGPVSHITENDLIGDAKNPPLLVTRVQQPDAYNIFQIQHFDRNNKYNQALTAEPMAGALALDGPRKKDPLLLPMIMDPKVARKIAAIQGRRYVHIRNKYTFKVPARFIFWEAMDIIEVDEPQLDMLNFPMRLTKVTENNDDTLSCEAEDFFYGLHAPQVLEATQVTSNATNTSVTPALINPPIFLEPPTAMTVNNALELWIGASCPDPTYGGCNVYISTDGGSHYVQLGTIIGNSITGILTQDWPPGLDPDFINDLKVDLSESLGELESYAVADMNNFVYPVWVEGATTCGYELGAYSTATLTGPNAYTLPASPNGLRRDVYHQPLSGSVDHPSGKRFMFLGAASSTGSSSKAGVGGEASILKVPLQPQWEGQTLYFKFQGFNLFGSGVQDLADCVPYTYTPGACAIVPAPEIVTISVTAPSAGDFTIPHGLIFTPLFAVIQMTSDGAIVLQRPLSVDATNVYLTASAPGITCNVSFFAAPADASVPLAPSGGGAYVVPHGLASTPTLELVQMDSLGDIWKDFTTPYTPTDLNLVAGSGGVTGKSYVWLTAPRTPTLTRFASIALAPGAPGNFSVAHGLGVIPKLVIVRMSSGGAIWLQSSVGGDATNLLLTASAGSITGEAEVWA